MTLGLMMVSVALVDSEPQLRFFEDFVIYSTWSQNSKFHYYLCDKADVYQNLLGLHRGQTDLPGYY
jgi:hypothetical protein